MFNDIAPRYDFLNHFLSMGIDIRWRKKVRRLIAPTQPKYILDVATGTGDLAIELAKLKPEKITGIDIAANMLEIDPPDDFERHRNDVVYSYQDNRNPFIDHPEFVEDIWGDPTRINTTEEWAVHCYPNPVSGNIFIEYQQNAMLTYTLAGIDGKVFMEGQVIPGKTSVNTSSVRNGFFILLLKDTDNRVVKRFKVLKVTH